MSTLTISAALTTTTARLTSAEAETLWRNWTERRDVRSRDRLVLAYAPMVRYLATRKIRELPAHCELDDLASSGLVALMEAVDRFDPTKGATFEQFVWTRISGSLVDELRRQDWASRSVRRAGKRIEGARDAVFARTGTMPTEDELAQDLELTVAELRSDLDDIARAEIGSLNAPARGADDPLTLELGDTVEAPVGEHEPETTALASERNAAMRLAIRRLSEREREILTLIHVEELPGAEVGRRLGVCESRISQILTGIRRKLKDQLSFYDGERLAA
jgi:RNA polymerase sigma factor FliA